MQMTPSEPLPPPPPPPVEPRRPDGTLLRRRRTVIAVVAIVAVLAGTLTAVLITRPRGGPSEARSASHPSRPRAPSQPTVPQQILLSHTDSEGHIDLGGALELFSYAFTPLSGVTLPSGPADRPADWTDTALDAMLSNWSELTVDQRRVVLSYLDTSQSAGSSSSAATAGTAAAASRPIPGPSALELTGYRLDGSTVSQQLQVKVQQALQDEAGRLGHTLADVGITNPATAVQAVQASVESTDSDGQAGAWTWGTSGTAAIDPTSDNPPGLTSGKPTSCYIYFPPSFWNNLSWTPGGFQYDALYHEVFHCYQFFVLGHADLSDAYAAPSWLIEGSAEWAGDSMSGYDDPTWATVVDGKYYGYLNNPRTSLDAEAHAAFGLFYEIEYLGRSLWPVWWGIWSSASGQGWATGDWFDAVAGDEKTMLTDSWGASYYVNAGLGHDWTETAAHQTTTYQQIAPSLSGALSVTADPYSTYQEVIPEQAAGDLVVIATADGTPRFVDGAGHEQTGNDLVALCWSECNDNKCPQTSEAGPSVMEVSGSVSWALTALDDGGIAELTPISKNELCKKNWKPQQTPPCSWNCGGSNGDPHIRTVNDRSYNMQAAGEYVLLRSPDGSVEIQARQEPWSQKTSETVAVNTAVAARVGSHRVGVYAPGGAQTLQVDVDGATVPLSAPVTLSGGGRVARTAAGVEIDLPDGSVLWALYTSDLYGINIEVSPSAALRSNGVGLLGAVALGHPLPALPSGPGMPINTNPVTIYNYKYGTFAPAWRVTAGTSLFDYAPGKSTTSFDYPGYKPEGGPPVVFRHDPSALSAGEGACAGLVDVSLRSDCVYDVMITGDSGFAAAYTPADTFVSGRGSTAPSPGASPPPFTTPTAAPSTNTLYQAATDVDGTFGDVVGPDGRLDIVYRSGSTTWLAAFDPRTHSLATRVAISESTPYGGLASASGSLWLIEATGPGTCAVAEFDPATLQQKRSMNLPSCPISLAPAIVAAAGQLWVYEGNLHLDRLDITSLHAVQTVTVQSDVLNDLEASATDVFWSDETGVYRVDAATSSLVKIGDPVDPGEGYFPQSDGIWQQIDAGSVEFADTYEGAATTLDVGRDLIGADETSVYIEDPTSREVDRYPIQGGQGSGLGTSTVDSVGSPIVAGPQDAYRVFTKSPQLDQPQNLYVEDFPLG